MSSPEMADVLLQNRPCLVHAMFSHMVSGYVCRSDRSRLGGPVARICRRSPDWASLRMPDEMHMTAIKSELDDCVVMNSVAEGGSSLAVKEPGMTSTSNCGASSNEFYIHRQSRHRQKGHRTQGEEGQPFSLPDSLSQLKRHSHGNPARPRKGTFFGQGAMAQGYSWSSGWLIRLGLTVTGMRAPEVMAKDPSPLSLT